MSQEHALKKNDRARLVLTVKEKPINVARNTYQLVLEKPDDFLFAAGQSMKFNFQNEKIIDTKTGEARWRTPSFTIVSAPHEPYLVFVFRVHSNYEKRSPTKQSIMSLNAGDLVSMLGVLPDYSDEVIYPKESEKGPIVMLAGGVGIAPFISMMRHAKYIGDTRDFHVLYSNPTYSDVVYEEEVDANPRSQKFLTRDVRDGFRKGYFTQEVIQNICEGAKKEPLFLISGSEGMVHTTEAMFFEMGVAKARIRLKKYTGYTEFDDTLEE